MRRNASSVNSREETRLALIVSFDRFSRHTSVEQQMSRLSENVSEFALTIQWADLSGSPNNNFAPRCLRAPALANLSVLRQNNVNLTLVQDSLLREWTPSVYRAGV